MSSPTISPSLQRIATLALTGMTYYLLSVVAVHLLRPDIDPIGQLTSAYKAGPYGFLMTSALFVFSLAQGALILALYQGISVPARSRVGLALLGVWAVGNLIAALFLPDRPGAQRTITGAIAQLNGPFHVLSLVGGAILVSRRFKHDHQWRPLHRSALIVSLVMLVAFIAVTLLIATGSGVAGLIQRTLVSVALIWCVLMAMHARSIAIGGVRM